MKKIGILLAVFVLTALGANAQGAKNIKINEVMSYNTTSIGDEYGQHDAWIELCNASFSTYNVRGMYITTNKAVLNENLSAPERQKLMSIIPGGDERTSLSGRKHIVFYCGSNPSEGTLHITAKIDSTKSNWIALYDGNGIDLIDSITVPALAINTSYARKTDGADEWEVRDVDNVTPGIANTAQVNDKIARTKLEDPHGFAITILAMGTVFVCLALLYIFFRLLGILMDHLNTAKKLANKTPLKPVKKTVEVGKEAIEKTTTVMKDGLKTKGTDKKIYIAVIAMALKQYQDDVHDVESGIISIKPKSTNWHGLVK